MADVPESGTQKKRTYRNPVHEAGVIYETQEKKSGNHNSM